MKIEKITGASHGAVIDDELVLIHVETGSFFALRDTGLAIWNLLDSQDDLAAIETALAAEYAVDPATCADEVRKFADQLVEAGFARYC